MGQLKSATADVIVVGAGLAGASAAVVLGRQGVRVCLVDQRKTYPACFKAEKIEPDQVATLRRLRLLETIAPQATRIREVLSARNGRVFASRKIEQYGVYYGDLVNAVRRSVPSNVEFRQGRVRNIANTSDLQCVSLEGGETLTARLVVMATGSIQGLAQQLGLRRELICKDHSMAFGFTLARTDGRAFPFDAVTVYPNDRKTRISCLSLFPIGKTFRGNLFVFRGPYDEWVRAFLRNPRAELERTLPKLSTLIGDYEVVGKVESGRVDLYRLQSPPQAGLVYIGDVQQGVCPSTGTGLSKVFTDVEALCQDCVPAWLKTRGMDVEKIQEYYEHPLKCRVDAHSMQSSLYGRRVATSPGLRWRAAAALKFWSRWVRHMPIYFRLTRKLTA